MAAQAPETVMVDEIASLLEKCSAEELSNILQKIESGSRATTPVPLDPSSGELQQDHSEGVETVHETLAIGASSPNQPSAESPGTNALLVPTAPTGAPPPNGRKARTMKGKATNGTDELPPGMIAISDLMQILEEHGASAMQDVKNTVPLAQCAEAGEAIDVGVLAAALLERDREVQQLETKLAELQATLTEKDNNVADLNGALDQAVREVRHRQLDLELQQLKLEERIRANAELEMAQRGLCARIEEVQLQARHAALDMELSQTLTTPRGLRAQGALPWTLRKNRLVPVGSLPAPDIANTATATATTTSAGARTTLPELSAP